ncbi:MAG TPA: cupredoxin family copper-binding protein [Acidimicrobiales bacterium]|jgi:plastocyanin
MTRTLRHLAVTGAVAALLATACGSSDNSSSADTSSGGRYGGSSEASYDESSESSTDATTAAAPAPAGDGAVSIKDFAFSPGDATVAVGTAVTWTNNDSATHRIKSGDGSFDSEDLKNGSTFEHTFDTAGTFEYVCGIHPSMKGTITVTG